MNEWPDDMVETFKACIADGKSAREAGVAIGKTRCACLAKAQRLGLHFGVGNGLPRVERASIPVAVLGPPEPVTPAKGFTLLTVPAYRCRWPIAGELADMVICGAKADPESSYCVFHRGIGCVASATTSNQLQRSLRKYST